MTVKFADDATGAIPVDIVSSHDIETYCAGLEDAARAWVQAQGFTAGLGRHVLVPNDGGGIAHVVVGWGTEAARKRGRHHLAGVAASLPEGVYCLRQMPEDVSAEQAALSWLLAQYVFDRYKDKPAPMARLAAPDGVDASAIEALAQGDFLARDLINTPASDMGPEALEEAFLALAARCGAQTQVIRGEDLLDQNFPMIHTVGRASAQAPRLLDMRWGDTGPKVTLVGKGVCFDTGGLNIKTAASMGLMKKDMGGAANAMALAQMIMSQGLAVQLRLLVPAVENAISGNAYRPQDVLTSRKGLTVEINNTDAEGRLVLADALALGDEESPDLMVCMATLTGAARVAMGPDVPPFFTDDDALAAAISNAAGAVDDPLWRMPFWDPYEAMIEPNVADLDNAPKGGFGGAITAALFLRRFVDQAARFVHVDLYGWTPSDKPGRSQGGACQGPRALLEVIRDMANS